MRQTRLNSTRDSVISTTKARSLIDRLDTKRWNPTAMIISELITEQRAAGWQIWAFFPLDLHTQSRWITDKKSLQKLLCLTEGFFLWFCNTSNKKRWVKVQLDANKPFEIIASYSVLPLHIEDPFASVIVELKRWTKQLKLVAVI